MNKIVIALIIAVAAAGPAVASEETEVMAAVSTIRPSNMPNSVSAASGVSLDSASVAVYSLIVGSPRRWHLKKEDAP